MSDPIVTTAQDRDLTLTCLIDATPDKVFRAWTEPELMKQWFCPKPWTTPFIETDVRAGGKSLVVMQGPDGQQMPCPGLYLEVVPNEKIVFTDAFRSAWEPSEKPFLVGTLTFTAEAGKTRYTALLQHWSVADREAHEAMGFHEGWKTTTQQLRDLVANL